MGITVKELGTQLDAIAREIFKADSWALTGVSFCTAEVATKEDHDGETESAGQ